MSFLPTNYQSAPHSKLSMARPSLNIAVKVAHLVQRLKGRLKSLIEDCVPSVESYRLPHPAKFKTHAYRTVQA